MMNAPKNDYKALVLALTLDIGMDNDTKANAAKEIAESIEASGNLSEIEIKRAKKQALKNLEMEC